ncbi:hypothetical protein [Ensifer canadensis]|uniref:hypothetical protein n=1 Tax=Ensifer canadensis TaxID=555315 RepID=UPI0035E3E833
MPIYDSKATGKKKLLRVLLVSLTALAVQSDGIAAMAEVLPQISQQQSPGIPNQILISNNEELAADPQAPVRFDLLDPAQYALQAKDYGGIPPTAQRFWRGYAPTISNLGAITTRIWPMPQNWKKAATGTSKILSPPPLSRFARWRCSAAVSPRKTSAIPAI